MISLHDINFSNLEFWIGFMATSFPNSLEEETDLSLTDLMVDEGMGATNWWRKFTKYYDGVIDESDGYLEGPETLIYELTPTQSLKIEFHPGDTVYYINDNQIACTGPHYIIQKIPFKELLNFMEDKRVFLLLLPLAAIDTSDKNESTEIISNVLQNIFDKRLCSRYANCIVCGLIQE